MLGGLWAGLQTNITVSWIWYGYGSLAYLGAIGLLLAGIPTYARQLHIGYQRLKTFRRYAVIFVGVSLAFPLIWILTPAALGVLNLDGEVIAFLPFDLATKVVLMYSVVRAGEG